MFVILWPLAKEYRIDQNTEYIHPLWLIPSTDTTRACTTFSISNFSFQFSPIDSKAHVVVCIVFDVFEGSSKLESENHNTLDIFVLVTSSLSQLLVTDNLKNTTFNHTMRYSTFFHSSRVAADGHVNACRDHLSIIILFSCAGPLQEHHIYYAGPLQVLRQNDAENLLLQMAVTIIKYDALKQMNIPLSNRHDIKNDIFL